MSGTKRALIATVRSNVITGLLVTSALLLVGSNAAQAEDSWTPFAKKAETPPRPNTAPPVEEPAAKSPFLSPMEGLNRWLAGKPADRPAAPPAGETDGMPAVVGADRPPPPLDSKSRAVESGALEPATAPDGSGLPYDVWQGLDLPAVEKLMTEIELPPRSPALAATWRRLLTAPSAPLAGASEEMRDALSLEALYRSGWTADMADVLARAQNRSSPLAQIFELRQLLADRDAKAACATQRELAKRKSELPRPLRVETVLAGGYCAAIAGNPAAAGLTADLAREEGAAPPVTLELLDAVALGRKPALPANARLSVLDWKLVQMVAPDATPPLDRIEPAVLTSLANDPNAPPKARIAAAEAASRAFAITPDQLAEAWRRAAGARSDPEAAANDPLLRRAALFQSAETERTPQRKARQLRALLDDARRAGLYVPAARAVERTTFDLTITPEIGWFAETAIEVALLAGRFDEVRRIAGLQGLDRPDEPLASWLALADIADPALQGRRGQSLTALEHLALRGRFTPDLLHRLVTVLDALDYNVPIPLWDAANRNPQPTGGYLPGTGVLSELQDASKKKQLGRTVLLAMRTLGPSGPDQANILSLGDAIRALKRAGLEAEARRVGLEALFIAWPRATSN